MFRKSYLLLIFISQLTFAQGLLQTSAKIEKVTVFANQAQVFATLNLRIPEGASKIEILDLPATIDQNSIRVKGTGALTLLSVNFEKDFLSKKMKAWQDSLTSVSEAIETQDMWLQVVQKQEKMVMDNTKIKSDTDDLFAEDLEEMSKYFQKKLGELGLKKLEISRKLKKLNEQKVQLEKQIATDPTRNQPLGKLLLNVNAKNATTANLQIEYLAYGVGWSPSYDIRVANVNAPLNVTYKANVYQNTGIDWKNVMLTLSTAAVNKNSTKPQIYPQYLAFYEKMEEMQLQARSGQRKEVMLMDAAAPMAEEINSSANFVTISENTLSRTYELDIPYSVGSGQTETVQIQDLSIKADYQTYVVPKYDSNGFLVAEITDWEQYNLMPAEANVYFEDGFVGKVYLGNAGVKDKMQISLGRDESIEAERKEILDYKSRRTFGSNIREDFGYDIVVRNKSSKAAQIIIEDQVPISQDSDIEVDIKELSNGMLDSENGKVTWKVNVPAGSTQKVALKYEVKYPKDKMISNL